jgi:hypothetical protein
MVEGKDFNGQQETAIHQDDSHCRCLPSEGFVYPFANVVRWPSPADANHFPYRVFLHGALNGLGFLFNQITDQASDALAGAAGLLPKKAILPFRE